MGVLDWLSRRRPLEPPPDLREALIAACIAQKHDVMARLIDANVAAIRESFPEWTTVPLAIRNDSEALERYARTLYTVASMFERAGDGSLMIRLCKGNPMAEWDTDLVAAQALIDEQRAAEAVTC